MPSSCLLEEEEESEGFQIFVVAVCLWKQIHGQQQPKIDCFHLPFSLVRKARLFQ